MWGKKGRWEFLGRVIRRPISIYYTYAATLLLCMPAQSCPTLCDPMDCSPSGSSVHESSQARILEWVVIALSKGSSWPSGRTHASCIGRHVPYCSATWESPYICMYTMYTDFPGSSVVKNLPASSGDSGSIPGSGRSPGGGNDNSLKYSCLENPTDRGAWQATVHGMAKESDMT